jgi:hypothetical protein
MRRGQRLRGLVARVVDPVTATTAAAPLALPRADPATDSSRRPVAALPRPPPRGSRVGRHGGGMCGLRRQARIHCWRQRELRIRRRWRWERRIRQRWQRWRLARVRVRFCVLDFFFAIFHFSLAHGLNACIPHAVHHPHGNIIIFIYPIGQAVGTTARKKLFRQFKKNMFL